MNDSWLIREAIAGDEQAFRFLVLRYQRPVFRFLTTFQLPQPVIEEIAQECFLRVYRNLSAYDPSRGTSFSSWIFTIARNLTLDEIRKKRHRVEVPQADIEDLRAKSDPASTDPQERLERLQMSRKVSQAIERLPHPFRRAVVLSFFGELSVDEIASIEKCRSGTVKSRIYRGKRLLRSILREELEA